MLNIFHETSKEELKILYEDFVHAKNEGLRPRSFDSYISKIQKELPLTFGESWKYTEQQFFDEVANRYFSE